MSCDLCGKSAELVQAIVEGSMLNVCRECSKFGNVIQVNKTRPIVQSKIRKIMHDEDVIDIVRVDFHNVIKEAREKLGLKQEDLAKKLNEKESLLHKLETGNIRPSLDLARKIEKVLNIKLVEKHIEDQGRRVNLKDDNLTIGDLIKIKEKK